jgi:hypothetical protein
MKKIVFIMLFMASAVTVFSQASWVFYTNKKSVGGGRIKIVISGDYVGDITGYVQGSSPDCGASGCVTVRRSDGVWIAYDVDGYELDRGNFRGYTNPNECRKICVSWNGDRDYGNNQTNNNSNTSSPYAPRSDEDLKNLGLGMAIAIAAIAIPLVSNDIYMNYTEGQFNRGFNFGFRNTMAEHIDLELGTGYSQWQNTKWFSKAQTVKPGLWTLDFAALYNILPKDKDKLMVNPYIGFGASVLPLQKEIETQFAFGGIVGLSFGKRLKGHIRYKWLKDWAHNQVMVNQVEIGVSITYKYGWKFSDQ